MNLNIAWYVAQVMTGKEQEVAEKLNAAGMQAIAPTEIIEERRNGNWWPRRRSVFPGYIFINTAMTDRVYYFIKKQMGVIRLLGSSAPESVPPEQMEAVLYFDNNGRDFGISEGKRKGGKTVITKGPLKQLSDKITKVNARARRATVEIPLLNSTLQVECSIKVSSSKEK
jgi:transcriptional antiterminator NusG